MSPLLGLLHLVMVALTLAQTDKRCFLEGGWSTISFFVREDLAIGSIIGKIRAIGVVGQDIALGLASGQEDVPVSVVTSGGEASLQLTGQLDKEGVLGPSNLIVGVICERLGTNDTGFTIPINIRYIQRTANQLNKHYSRPAAEFVQLVCSSLYIMIS